MENGMTLNGTVAALARSGVHAFSKDCVPEILLVEGKGVEGDAHFGEKVQHRSRVAVDPDQPNLRQVHLVTCELFSELAAAGFDISPGELGENITVSGIDLITLPRGTRLRFGDTAELEVTGLRNPCAQIDDFRPGLLARVVGKDADGKIIRRAGVMAVVSKGGIVRRGDPTMAILPPPPHLPLERV